MPGETDRAKRSIRATGTIIAEIEDLKVSWSERVRILLLRD
jgi:hypothetical protein